METKIRLGISTCLLGEKVRYDGGHKLDRYLRDTLGQYVQYIPVCPEVECGLPTPRESMRLVGDPKAPRLMTVRSQLDLTEKMIEWTRIRVRELELENLCGFIFKSKSPSSGMERVKVYNEKQMPEKIGVGIFARAYMEHFTLYPVEEDGRMHDPILRENFIVRIFAFKRWRDLLSEKKTRGNIVEFHTKHKLLILAHSEKIFRIMGKLVGNPKEVTVNELYEQYQNLLLESLCYKTTIRKNVNVLQHAMGYFKKILSSDEKTELLEIIEQYKNRYVPLIVPITLLNHYVRKYDQTYLKQQYYLSPHPIELQLRNHV
ncbi:MAG: DUF523 and DUF1722 domain-containing protein [bacterium]